MKVVAEIKHWANRSYGRNYQVEWIGQAETGDKLVTLAEAEAAVKQARIDALEEAKQACEAISVDRWSLYKGRAPYTGQEPGRADPDTQGQSDGADACAAAIESLKETP